MPDNANSDLSRHQEAQKDTRNKLLRCLVESPCRSHKHVEPFPFSHGDDVKPLLNVIDSVDQADASLEGLFVKPKFEHARLEVVDIDVDKLL